MRTYVIMGLLFFFFSLTAHLPRLVSENSLENPVIVTDPEISQAFYGRLTGKPDYFKIQSSQLFKLYVNILVPEVMGARIDFVADIFRDQTQIMTLKDAEWTHFYEHFAGDNYIRGPEFEQWVDSGAYVIKISNEDNLGAYILAIGKKEWFTPSEILNTYRLLPYIKEEFFHKSPLTAYFNLFTLLLVGMVVLVISLAAPFIHYIVKLWLRN